MHERRWLADYVVVCDERNNPPSVVDNNELYVDIMIKPNHAVNFINMDFKIAPDTKKMELEPNSVLDTILANQRNILLKALEAEQPDSLDDFKKILLPMIRRIIPGTIANELIGAQPMTDSAAQVIGYKGHAEADAGHFRAPYIPQLKPNEFKPLNISAKLKGWTGAGGFNLRWAPVKVGQPVPYRARWVEGDGDSEVPPLAAE